MDCNFVTARLAVGGQISSIQELELLVSSGVTDIVDCQAERDDTPLVQQLSDVMTRPSVCWNPTQDDGQPKSAEWFAKSIDFALQALTFRHRKVYVHCAAGVNRGPSACYAILRAWGIGPADAERTIRIVRPQVGIAYKQYADMAIGALGYA